MADTQLLNKLKRRLGIAQDDTQEDDLLQDILEDAEAHFKLLAETDIIDSKYQFIILDIADMRYNRKGSTGMKSESVDGYSVTWQDAKDDFAPYMSIIIKDFDIDNSLGEREKGNAWWW